MATCLPSSSQSDADDLTSVIRDLLPYDGAVCVTLFDPGAETPPETVPAVAGAIRKRRAEFAAGRRCAIAALRSLGVNVAEIPSGPLGQPIWPPLCQGSISHDGALAAAVAFRVGAQWHRVGLDIMLSKTLDYCCFDDLAEIVLSPEERRISLTDVVCIRTAFMLKEAAIKIASPTLARLVDFQEILLTRTGRGSFVGQAPSGLEIKLRSGTCRIGSAALAWT